MGQYIDAVTIQDDALDVTITDVMLPKVEHLIGKVEGRVHARCPLLAARVIRGDLPSDLVAGVVEDVVLRFIRNPQAYKQVAVDDGSITLDQAASSGLLDLNEQDLELLGCGGSRRRSVGSIRLGIPAWRLP